MLRNTLAPQATPCLSASPTFPCGAMPATATLPTRSSVTCCSSCQVQSIHHRRRRHQQHHHHHQHHHRHHHSLSPTTPAPPPTSSKPSLPPSQPPAKYGLPLPPLFFCNDLPTRSPCPFPLCFFVTLFPCARHHGRRRQHQRRHPRLQNSRHWPVRASPLTSTPIVRIK